MLASRARPALLLGGLLLSGGPATGGNEPPAFPPPRYTEIQPGLEHAELRSAAGPWRVYIVRLDRQQQGLKLRAAAGGGTQLGLATAPQQARTSAQGSAIPLAAINGGYFREARNAERGTPAGLLIIEGELCGRPANTSFWVDDARSPHIAVVHSKMEVRWPDGSTSPLRLNELPAADSPALITPRFGTGIEIREGSAVQVQLDGASAWPGLRASSNHTASVWSAAAAGPARIPVPTNAALLWLAPAQAAKLALLTNGAALRVTTTLSHDLSRAVSGVGAGPTLLTGGTTNDWLLRPDASNGHPPREPRSAIGFNGRHLFLVVVDGRSWTSVGMTYLELASLMAQLGCTEAMNLDGGTSSTLWVRDRVLNSPSGWITPAVGNTLVILGEPAAR